MSLPHKSKEEILHELVQILHEDFDCPVEKIKLETQLYADLDLDSIDAVDLVVKLQKMTGKRVNPEEFRQVKVIGDVVDIVHNLLHREVEELPGAEIGELS